MSDFAEDYVAETIEILRSLDVEAVDRVAAGLAAVRDAGRGCSCWGSAAPPATPRTR